MPAGVGGWDNGMSCGKEHWGRRSLIPLGWGHIGKVDWSSFAAIDTGIAWGGSAWGGLDLRKSRKGTDLPSAYLLLGRNDPWTSRGYLLGLGSGIKRPSVGGRLGEDGLWDPQEMWARGKEGCIWCCLGAPKMRLVDWIWGNTERREGLSSLSGFLTGV